VVFRAVVFKLLVWCGAEGYVSSLQDAAASCKPDTWPPVAPPGIDPGTIRLVAQCFNHYTTPGPLLLSIRIWYRLPSLGNTNVLLQNCHSDRSYTNSCILHTNTASQCNWCGIIKGLIWCIFNRTPEKNFVCPLHEIRCSAASVLNTLIINLFKWTWTTMRYKTTKTAFGNCSAT